MQPPTIAIESNSVLIVGASARAAAVSAARAGYDPIAIDLFTDRDLASRFHAQRSSPDWHDLLPIARRLPPCPWFYTGAMENRPELVGRLAAERPLYGNSKDVLRGVRDPWRLLEVLRADGFLFPEVRSPDEQLGDGRWLQKPLAGAAGGGIRVVADRRPHSCSAAVYLQRYIAGPSYGASFVAGAEDTQLLGITRQLIGAAWTGARGFRYAGSLGPIVFDRSRMNCFARLGSLLARQFQLRGLFGVDTVVNQQGIWTLEVNPRYTASIEVLERASGIAAVAQHVAACRRSRLPTLSLRKNGRQAGKAVLYAPQCLTVTQRFAELAASSSATATWPGIADVPAAGTLVERGKPVTTILAEGDTSDEVLQQLQRRAAHVFEALQ